MKYLIILLTLVSFLACTPKTTVVLPPDHLLSFELVSADGETEVYTSDSLSASYTISYPSLTYHTPPQIDSVRLIIAVEYALPDLGNQQWQRFGMQFHVAGVPRSLVQLSPDSSRFVFADPTDWVTRFFDNPASTQSRGYQVSVDVMGLSIGSLPNATIDPARHYVEYTSAKITTTPQGELLLSVSGQFVLPAQRWYPIGEPDWQLENGQFSFTVDLSEWY